MARKFVNKAGRVLTVHEFEALKKDPAYTNLREFKSDKIEIRAYWHGIVKSGVPQSNWKLFGLEVTNILRTDIYGEILPEKEWKRVKDLEGCQYFLTAEELLKAFDAMVEDQGATRVEGVDPADWVRPPAPKPKPAPIPVKEVYPEMDDDDEPVDAEAKDDASEAPEKEIAKPAPVDPKQNVPSDGGKAAAEAGSW